MSNKDDAYRNILESLLKFMEERNGGHLMRQEDVAAFTGLTRQTTAKRFGVGRNGIMAERLAMMLAKM